MTENHALSRLTAATLPALHRALREDLPPVDAARIARQYGFESGAAFHRSLEAWSMQQTGQQLSELSPESFWDLMGGFFSNLGWGELVHEQLHDGVDSLRAGNWAESLDHRDARHPTCHVTTGLLADLLSRMAGTDLAVMEVECRSTGSDDCRFLMGSPAALNTIYQTIREDGDLSAALDRL